MQPGSPQQPDSAAMPGNNSNPQMVGNIHAKMNPKQILCIKWGSVYNSHDVNILYAMVARNITGPFRLICLTDNAEGIRDEVVRLPLPELGCEIPPDVPGKWPKVALWNRELFGLKGVALFIDLDSVIVGNLDDYFTYGNPDDVITARNWVKPLRRLGQTSVFRFPIGKHHYMLENLRANPAGISRKYRFEQHYVTNCIKGGIKMWPPQWTRHYRLHCLGSWVGRLIHAPKLPRNAKIVTFAGGEKTRNAMQGSCCGNLAWGRFGNTSGGRLQKGKMAGARFSKKSKATAGPRNGFPITGRNDQSGASWCFQVPPDNLLSRKTNVLSAKV